MSVKAHAKKQAWREGRAVLKTRTGRHLLIDVKIVFDD
jgi:hypothetical protein